MIYYIKRIKASLIFTKHIVWISVLLVSLFAVKQIQAEETDQFTLPPGELVNIGPTVSRRLYKVLKNAVKKTNLEIEAEDTKNKADLLTQYKFMDLKLSATFVVT